MGSAVLFLSTRSGNRPWLSWSRRVPVPGMPPYIPAQQWASGKSALPPSSADNEWPWSFGDCRASFSALRLLFFAASGLLEAACFFCWSFSWRFANNAFRASAWLSGDPELSSSEGGCAFPPPSASTTTFSAPFGTRGAFVRSLLGLSSPSSRALSDNSLADASADFFPRLDLVFPIVSPLVLRSSPDVPDGAWISGSGSSASTVTACFFFPLRFAFVLLGASLN
mmetsp:Transcript_126216/g.365324  ORF Transcript_126216/g.365324 Transcript_126216/m.365324 type:complete len:225 (+) Transcript_126216:1924-2598(+)